MKIEALVTNLNELDDHLVMNGGTSCLDTVKKGIWPLNNCGGILKSLLGGESRVNWLKEGDCNSSFFHNVMRERHRKNHLSFVSTNNGRKEEVEEIKLEVSRFFKNNFKNLTKRSVIDGMS